MAIKAMFTPDPLSRSGPQLLVRYDNPDPGKEKVFITILFRRLLKSALT
jgi:hypothetical protein